jgi:hypothetical protein
LPSAVTLLAVPTYSGAGIITLTWNEQSESDVGSVASTFVWAMTP